MKLLMIIKKKKKIYKIALQIFLINYIMKKKLNNQTLNKLIKK